MKAATIIQKNGKMAKKISHVIGKSTGGSLKTAAGLGYTLGYKMGKYPQLEKAKCCVQKNYKQGLLTMLGAGIALIGLIGFIAKNK